MIWAASSLPINKTMLTLGVSDELEFGNPQKPTVRTTTKRKDR